MKYQPYDVDTHDYLWQKDVQREIDRVSHDGLTTNVYHFSSNHPHKGFVDLAEDRSQTVSLCCNCGQLYATQFMHLDLCSKAKPYFDANGKVVSTHSPEKNFDFIGYLNFLAKSNNWKDIFWRIWSLFQTFICQKCGLDFPGSQVSNCRYHRLELQRNFGQNKGFYPCCNQEAHIFCSNISQLS